MRPNCRTMCGEVNVPHALLLLINCNERKLVVVANSAIVISKPSNDRTQGGARQKSSAFAVTTSRWQHFCARRFHLRGGQRIRLRFQAFDENSMTNEA